jgi:hypothetical protein
MVKTKPLIAKRYIVIRDTREQQGWTFSESAYCAGTVIRTMKTGDYTIEGLENFLCVERKKNVVEFAKNIIEARFDRELVRLNVFPMAFIVLEFTIEDIMRWPLGSGIPKYKLPFIKINKYFILKRLIDFQTKYKNIQFIMAGSHGKDVLGTLFKKAIDLYGQTQVVRSETNEGIVRPKKQSRKNT